MCKIETLKSVIQKLPFPFMILDKVLCYFSNVKNIHFLDLLKIEDDILMQVLYAQYNNFFVK